ANERWLAPPPTTELHRQVPSFSLRHHMLLRTADVVALTTSSLLGAELLRLLDPTRAGALRHRYALVTAVAMAVALHLHGLYRRPASRLRPSAWWRPWVIARCLPTAALLALGTEALLAGSARMTVTAAVAMTVPSVGLIPLGRHLMLRVFGPAPITRILVVGSGPVTDRVIARLERCSDTTVIGQVDDLPRVGTKVLGTTADLGSLCQRHRVDRILVSFSTSSDRDLLKSLRQLEGRVPVSVVPRLYELHSWRSELEELHGMPLLHISPATLTFGARVSKRAMDLTLALAAIVLALPVWLAVAAAIKLDSSGPVFFRQLRTGRGGRAFSIFKFRTMTDDAWDNRAALAVVNEVDGPLFKMRSDPRVTRVGRLLRKTSIDEFPQLLNVVRGEMSLVGPRPLPVEESDKLDGAALTRFDVSPGLTGLWQVSGRSDLSYADLQHLDSVYVRSWSLLWDLRIIKETPRCVLAGRGAY
ncbi:MAG TPA: sugar transferase, partial [Pseudonocardiaceae bacterium]|nr:sugar transferase [Pseudonocardiaceae bacterium]